MFAGQTVSYWSEHGFNDNGLLLDKIHPVNSEGYPRAEYLVNSFNMNFWRGDVLRRL